MKVLALTFLLCAWLALSQAAGPAEDKEAVDAAGGSHVVKRSAFSPSGWTRYNSDCYLYVEAAFTWAQAETYCLSQGANLASVHSKRQYKWMEKFIHKKTRGYPTTWIGGSDAEQERYWFWSDGSRPSYTKWCSGYPRISTSLNCMAMSPSECSCWYDYPCNYGLPFICIRK